MAYRLTERPADGAFIKTDSGPRSYDSGVFSANADVDAGSVMTRVIATGALKVAGAGLVAEPATEAFAGFLFRNVRDDLAPGETRPITLLTRDAEVWTDRVAWPVGADAGETAELRDAVIAAAEAAGIVFRDY